MTSANVVEYRIEKNGEFIGWHRQHLLCKTNNEPLLKYQPASDYTITPFGYDEEEEEWEGDPINLEEFLSKRNKTQL